MVSADVEPNTTCVGWTRGIPPDHWGEERRQETGDRKTLQTSSSLSGIDTE